MFFYLLNYHRWIYTNRGLFYYFVFHFHFESDQPYQYRLLVAFSIQTDVTSGIGTAYPSGAHELIPVSINVCVNQSLLFLCNILQTIVCLLSSRYLAFYIVLSSLLYYYLLLLWNFKTFSYFRLLQSTIPFLTTNIYCLLIYKDIKCHHVDKQSDFEYC